MMDNNTYIAEFRNIHKSFSGVKVLDDVSLKICEGSVHAIVGENGAGKSTLIKILAGIYNQDNGHVIYEGEVIDHLTIRERQQKGISIVHQEIVDFPNLTIASNIFAGIEEENQFGFVDERLQVKKAQELLNQIDSDIDAREIAGSQNSAKRQMMMIAKALAYNVKLIIMDEPNSALTDEETLHLFEIIKVLKTRGVTIVYISHRLEEVLKIADYITVMRDGCFITTIIKEEASVDRIITNMVGREMKNLFPIREHKPILDQAEVLLDVKNISYKDKLHDISFQLRKGEILGFAGLMDSGRTMMAEAIIGLNKASTEIDFCCDRYSPKDPCFAYEHGIGYVPPERKLDSLFSQRSIKHNLTLSILKLLKRFNLISEKKMKAVTADFVNRLQVKLNSLDQSIMELSGGNQQKVVIARSLATSPKVIIVNQPTRGIDVGAKYEIYKLIHELADNGMGVIYISSEMPEILNMCENVIVFHEGRISGRFSRESISNELVLNAMMGTP